MIADKKTKIKKRKSCGTLVHAPDSQLSRYIKIGFIYKSFVDHRLK